jgi:phosphoribosyl-ATP pyrophosphohydrolase/phosphoribosyl-AMP cyclohydrolase/histidinol dehydrogenase
MAEAGRIVARIRQEGEPALRALTEQFAERAPGDPLVIEPPELHRALERLPREDRARLERVAGRISAFAEAQRGALRDIVVPIPGGVAGHTATPMERAGCYVPGGRYPLPSSALMTALPARVAGVRDIWIATPKPAPVTLAAAALAGAEGVLVAGGAHAIAALAFGAGPVPACDAVVGPGNLYVTAAKQLVAGRVAIDMLAGPSELVILADHTADPGLVAADLLAQAEHDTEALPVLVTTYQPLLAAVEAELAVQLADLPTAPTARAALANGGAIWCPSLEQACAACSELAAEHLELMVEDPESVRGRITQYGALFIGDGAAEVFGDYGAGPNHTLPTSRTARSHAGLSVFTFLRTRTWMRVDDPAAAHTLAQDAAWFGRIEGLEAHARAAERRLSADS